MKILYQIWFKLWFDLNEDKHWVWFFSTIVSMSFSLRIFVYYIWWLISLYLGYGQMVWAQNFDAQLLEIQKWQMDVLLQQKNRNYSTPEMLKNWYNAHRVVSWARWLQTATKHFNTAFSCDLTTRQLFDVLTTYPQIKRFINRVLWWWIQIDTKAFVWACKKFAWCYGWQIVYSDESYRICKDIIATYYNHAFMLHSTVLDMHYDMLGEGNFVDADTKNVYAPYDLLANHEDMALALDNKTHPVTISTLYPSVWDISSHVDYTQFDSNIDLMWEESHLQTPESITAMIWWSIQYPWWSYENLIPKLFASTTSPQIENNISPSSSSSDPQIQQDIQQIMNTLWSFTSQDQNSLSSQLWCETWVQQLSGSDAQLLSWFAHLVNIRKQVINADISTQYALENTGLWYIVDRILQDHYPDKIVNDTTLYETVYGPLPDINQIDQHYQLFGQMIDERPSFDSAEKQEQITKIAQSDLSEKISDLWWWTNTYEQDAAICKKEFSESFSICQDLWDFKQMRSCVENILLTLKICVRKATCTNLSSPGDYLGITICRVSKWLDKATTKTHITSLQEIVDSIRGPLNFLKNSGKILPHKVKREFFETTLNFKLSHLLSFQIWHNSKLLRTAGDHKKKKQDQEQKNRQLFEDLNAIIAHGLSDKDKYSVSYNPQASLALTPGATWDVLWSSLMLGADIQGRKSARSYPMILKEIKMRHRNNIMDIEDQYRKATRQMRDNISQQVKQQAHIAKSAREANDKS